MVSAKSRSDRAPPARGDGELGQARRGAAQRLRAGTSALLIKHLEKIMTVKKKHLLSQKATVRMTR